MKHLILIGHGAYEGMNAQMLFRTPAGALRELVRRGIDPQRAERALAEALAKPNGYAMASSIRDVIEVRNVLQRAQDESWPVLHYTLDDWKRASAFSETRRGPYPTPP